MWAKFIEDWKNRGKTELKPCPYCGGEPKLIRVGNQKEYVVYICRDCYRTPVKNCEARCTERDARKIWNKRCSDDS